MGRPGFDLAGQVVEDAQVVGVQHVAAGAAKVVVEGAHHGGAVIQRVADRSQRQPRVEAGRWGGQAGQRVRPQAETGCGKRRPWKQRARVVLAGGRHVFMADDLRTRNVPARRFVTQQLDQAGNLHRRKGFVAVVVDLDADRCGIDVGDGAPAPATRVPGAIDIADQLVDVAVAADQVMRTDRAPTVGGAQRVQRLLDRVLVGEMQHDQLRFADVEILRRHPRCHGIARWQRRAGAQCDQGDACAKQPGGGLHAMTPASRRRWRSGSSLAP